MNAPLEKQENSADKADDCATKVVNLIQQCIHVIRSIPEFSPKKPKTQPFQEQQLQNVMLYTELESHGLVQQIGGMVQEMNSSFSTTLFHGEPGVFDTQETTTERSRFVYRVLSPLVRSLYACYQILDKEEEQPRVTKPSSRQGRNVKAPPPPRGMLSIQNYTDIAVLLELLVCTSILPNLQQNILASVQDRFRYQLPKSLAGRIPPGALLWACAVSTVERQKDLSSPSPDIVIDELKQTALAMGRLVLLDRFRPMLLPRHLVDVYAAMFQAEALESITSTGTSSERQDHSLEDQNLHRTLLVCSSSTLSSQESNIQSSKTVDPYTHARACQSLLFRGTKAPLWLRRRVSLLLSNLACRDLGVIVQVFVQEGATSREEMTAASMRLARTLTTTATSQSSDEEDVSRQDQARYHGLLCRELIRLLDVPAVKDVASNEANVVTVWAVLYQLPLKVLVTHFLPLLRDGLIPETNSVDKCMTVHKTVMRFRALLSCAPSSFNPSKLCRLFLRAVRVAEVDSHGSEGVAETTLFGQLLRISSMHSVLESSIKKDALWCLGLLVDTMCRSTFQSWKNRSIKVSGTHVAAMAIIYSVAPSSWDANGYQYQRIPSDNKHVYESIRVANKQIQDSHSDIPRDVEQRAKFVIDNLIAPLARTSHEKEQGELEPAVSSTLPSRIFNLLLQIYFATSSKENHLGGLFRRNTGIFALVAMTLLPHLCEACSPLSLLQSNNAGSAGFDVLETIKLVLHYASSSLGEHVAVVEKEKEVVDNGQTAFQPSLLNVILDEILGGDKEEEKMHSKNIAGGVFDALDGSETLLSITSIVLSILVALLELGSDKRREEDESMLLSMVPSLQSLAVCAELKGANGDSDGAALAAGAELAEMASHAAALISCRSLTNAVEESRQLLSNSHSRKTETFENTLKQAEKDLQSEQPAFRARGVVALRHLARGYLVQAEEANSDTDHRDKPLIQELGGDDDVRVDNDIDNAVERILDLSIRSLADAESYVYLAGVQTIVSVADVHPKVLIPMIGRGVCTGKFQLTKTSSDEVDKQLILNESQRVKLTEALLFTIRRRGSAVYAFAGFLMDIMLFGRKEYEMSTSAQEKRGDTEDKIQGETHHYFMLGNDPEESCNENLEVELGERRVRVATGGPVFDQEEGDLVRAACISVVSELVAVSHPKFVARYCPHLNRLASTALKLDLSRPVRRVAAMLCRELYEAVLREYTEQLETTERHDNKEIEFPLAVEMSLNGEEAIFSSLKRCVACGDIEGSSSMNCTSHKVRLFDPATVSRAQEALDNRSVLEDTGVLAAAEVIAKALERDENDSVSKLVRSNLQGSSTFQAGHSIAVGGMRRLRFDPNMLKLE